jgi:putative membrane protein
MRVLYVVILLLIVGAVIAFAVQNEAAVALHFLNLSATLSVAQLAGIAYLLGMVSGWSVLSLLRRTVERVTERRRPAGP